VIQMRRSLLPLAVPVLAILLAACGGASGAASSGPPASVDPNAPKVVAQNLAFQQTSIQVPAGKPFTLVFENQDGAPHNIAISSDAGFAQKLFDGEVFSGPGSRNYQVNALPAGTYHFRCDVHTNMTGTIVAG
jgi:plastocyanin